MGWQHGKDTEISVDAKDISAFCSTSEMNRGADSHDVTGYGKDDHVFQGGLRKGSFSCEGTYENTVSTGPHDVLDPLVGTVVEVIRKPEGTGTGKPLQTFQALLEEYVETNPVADMVKWSAKFTVSDVVVPTTQA